MASQRRHPSKQRNWIIGGLLVIGVGLMMWWARPPEEAAPAPLTEAQTAMATSPAQPAAAELPPASEPPPSAASLAATLPQVSGPQPDFDFERQYGLLGGQAVHPTRVLAKLRPESEALAGEVLRRFNYGVRPSPGLPSSWLVLDQQGPPAPVWSDPTEALARGKSLQRLIKELKASGAFEFVEPDVIRSGAAEPTDAGFTNGDLWALKNEGQNKGTAGQDIDAVRAWDLTTGSTSVIVAVIDTGVRYTHQDLVGQMWVNPGEVAGNGIDDDNDGYIDNIHGIDAITGSGNPMDDQGHGTHVAGIIGAAANGGGPGVGVAWKVSLMACRWMKAAASGARGFDSDAIESIDFAVKKGARIINASWRMSDAAANSEALKAAIREARQRGVLFVAAAGNDAGSNDSEDDKVLPASFELENIISVAATDRTGKLDGRSNWGKRTVHLGAPGADIYSALHTSDSSYGRMSGTSMAAPHVSGVAALLLARYPDLALVELKQRILLGVVPSSPLKNRTITGGALNAYNAINGGPDGVMELSVYTQSGAELVADTDVTFFVQVTDAEAVTDATVTGHVEGLPDIVFSNQGRGADAVANDHIYSATLRIPSTAAVFSIRIEASAPFKSQASESYDFSVKLREGNDNFSDRQLLEDAAVGSNLGASKELGEPSHADNPGGSSVWWTWTAPERGTATISTYGSNFDTLLAVYTGNSVSTLRPVASSDEGDEGGMTSTVRFEARAGVTYQIAVDGYRGVSGEAAAGDIELSVSLEASPSAPANNNFANAAEMSGTSGKIVTTNAGADREEGEPDHAGGNGGASIWWTWTAPASGQMTLSTVGSRLDTAIAVYRGNAVGELIEVASDLRGGPSSSSQLTFTASAGTVYRIAIDGQGGGRGAIVINYALEVSSPPPANDAFASATVLTLTNNEVLVTGSNVRATKEAGEPYHAGNIGGASVWWTWTAPTSGTAMISTAGSEFDTLLAVYQGSSVGALTLVEANDQDASSRNTSRLSFTATAGTTYRIAVDGGSTGLGVASGAVQLALRLIPSGTTPDNDDFADRVALPAEGGVISAFNIGATREAQEPFHAANPGGSSVWWTWTAPSSGVTTISTVSSDFDTVLAVYAGLAQGAESLGALAVIAQNDDYEGGSTSQVTFRSEPGITYAIAVDGFNGDAGLIQLQLTHSEETAAELAAPTSLSATSIGSLGFVANWQAVAGASGYYLDVSTNPVFPLGFVPGYERMDVGDALSRSVTGLNAGTTYYFRVRAYASGSVGPNSEAFTVVTSGAITIPTLSTPLVGSISSNGAVVEAEVLSAGGAAVTQRGILYGTSPTPLPSNATVVRSGAGTGNYTASLEGRLAPATTYYVRAYATNGIGTAYSTTVSFVTNGAQGSAPANDQGAAATLLTGGTQRVAGTNVGATGQASEPDPFANPTVRSVWWRWVAPESGRLSLSTAGSGIDTTLAVYSGSAWESLSPVASNDDESPPTITTSFLALDVTAGTTYWFRVDGLRGAVGSISLALSFPQAPLAAPATQVTTLSARANWSAVAGATGYRLDLSTRENFSHFVHGHNNVSVGSGTSLDLAVLAAGTTYYYRVRAFNATGASFSSNVVSFTTPSFSQRYALTSPAPDTANLAETATRLDPNASVADWDELKTEIASGALTLEQLYAQTGMTDGASAMVLKGGQRYFGSTRQYYLQRFDQGPYAGFLVHDRIGETLYLGSWFGYSMPVLAKLVAAPIVAPAVPVLLPPSGATSTAFTLRWNASAGATGYRLDLSEDAQFGTLLTGWANLEVGNVTSYNVAGLAAGRTYYARVRATNAAGTSASSETQTISLATSTARYALTPDASDTSNLETVVTAYSAGASVGDWTLIKSELASGTLTLEEFYRQTGLADRDAAMVVRSGARYLPGTVRQYYLQRFESGPYAGFAVHDQVGTLYLGSWYGYSMPVVARIVGGTSTVPPAPVAVTATDILADRFTAGWAAVSGATGYRLDVSATPDFQTFHAGFQNLDVGTALNRVVTGLTFGTTYYYRVRAVNAVGTSLSSNVIAVNMAAALGAAPTFRTHPASTLVDAGSPASLTVDVQGVPAPSIVWQVSRNGGTTWEALTNGSTYADVTRPTLRVLAASMTQNGDLYRALASNAVENNVASNAAMLSVRDPSAVALTDSEFDFAGGTMPAGWIAWENNYGGRDFANERLNAYGANALHRIYRPYQVPGGTSEIQIYYRGNMATSLTGGGGNALWIGTTAGTYQVAHGWSSISPSGQMNSDVSLGETVLSRAFMPRLFEAFDYAVILRDGLIIQLGYREDGSLLFEHAVPIPGFALSKITRFDLGVFVTAAINLWLDDIRLVARGTPVAAAPVITSHPSPKVARVGDTVTLTVEATGNPAPTYQWRRYGSNVAGETGASLVLTNAQFAQAGLYDVVVSNTSGSVTSESARVYVGQVGARYRLTDFVPSADDITAAAVAQYGSGSSVADWDEIHAEFGSNMGAFYEMIGLPDRLEVMLRRGTQRFFSGNRQYYAQRSDSGLPYAGFMVHAQTGALYLGSWYGLSMPVVVKVMPAVSTVAGLARSQGFLEGTGSAARFTYPQGVVALPNGDILVADEHNHRIRRITPAGVVSTYAGSTAGSANGPLTSATFSRPNGIARDSSGNLYVIEFNNQLLRKITPEGTVSTLASFNGYPGGVTVDSSGNVYVSVTGRHVIHRITPGGTNELFAGTPGVSGAVNGDRLSARLHSPQSLAFDQEGNLYVSDFWNHAVRRITPAGVVSTFAGALGTQGSTDGVGAAARFNGPSGIVFDGVGNLFVSDSGNFTIRKIAVSSAQVTTLAGQAGQSGESDGALASARFYGATGLALTTGGDLIVADASNHTIRRIIAVVNAASTSGLPTVVTGDTQNISFTSATVYGEVTSIGSSAVTQRGYVISTSPGPTIQNSTPLPDGSGLGSFASNRFDLSSGVTYYVRAFATNSAGTAYGQEKTFTTLSRGISLTGDLDFGLVAVGSNRSRNLIITNTGTAPLAVTGITLPTGFSGSWSGTLAAGASQTVAITFTPTAIGTYGGQVQVSSDSTAGTNTRAISGTGASQVQTGSYSDNFTGTLAGWVQMQSDVSASWQIQNGALSANYTISAGSPSNTQSFLLLSEQNQPTGDWTASVDFTLVTDPTNASFKTSTASFGIWQSTSAKLSIAVGRGKWNWGTVGPQTSIDVGVQHWNGSWRTVGLDRTVNLNWDPNAWNTATLKKTGTTYTVSVNGTVVLEFEDTFLQGQGSLGLHTYGAKRLRNFSVVSSAITGLAPAFETHPSSRSAIVGGSAQFSVLVSGTPTPTLRWQVSTDRGATWSNLSDGGVYSGTTATTLSVSEVTAGMNGYRYRAVASNSAQTGVASNAAELSLALALERLDFASGGVPSGWTAWPNNYGSYDFANQRMNAYKVDSTNRIYRALSVPSGATALQIRYRANVASGYWGGGNYAVLSTSTGDELQITHGWGDAGGGTFGTQMTAQISNETAGQVYHREQMPREIGEFAYTITVRDGSISHRGVRPNGTLVFDYTFERPSLLLSSINRLDLGLYQTVVDPLWLDDAEIEFISEPLFGDNFSGTLANWVQMSSDIAATWAIENGNLVGNYSTDAGGSTNTQSFLLLADEHQPSGDWVASVDFAPATQGGFTTARATFGLWLTSSAKLKIVVGTGGWGWTPSAQTTIGYSVERWTGSWSLVGLDGTANLTWNPADWNTATLRKTGTTYRLSVNGTQVLQFTDTYLNGEGKLGLATYGPSRFDDFLLEGSGPAATAPSFTTQPANVTANVGAAVSFSVATAGSPAPTLQWQRSTNGGTTWANLSNSGGFSGVTSATLSLSSVTQEMNGHRFRALASNTAQQDVASTVATLTVNAPDSYVLQSETLDFSTGTVPVGWTAWPNNYGSRDFANQRMNAYKVDSTNRIYRAFTVPSSATELQIRYRANVASGYWGGGNYIMVYTSTGEELGISHGWGDAAGGTNGTLMTAQINDEKLGTVLNREQMTRQIGEFIYTITLRDGSISHRGTKPDGTVVFDYTYVRPQLVLATVNRLDLALYQTVLDPLWMDDVQIQVLGSPAFSDAFATNLSGWTQMSGDAPATWEIQNGRLFANYPISSGSSGNTQSFLLLNDANQPTGNWRASVDFAAVADPSSPSLKTAAATFALWESASSKLRIEIGYGAWGWTPGPLNTVNFAVGRWNGSSWTVVANSQANVAWDATTWNTATLEKAGNHYTISLNGEELFEFTDTYLNGAGKLGLHTYGAKLLDNFVLQGVAASATPPQFSAHPQNTTVNAGAAASFTASVSGSPAPTLQWQRSIDGGTTWTDVANGGVFSGATTTTLSLSAATLEMNGQRFRLRASNSAQANVASNVAQFTVNSVGGDTLASEQIDFSSGGVPAGWTTWPRNYGNYDFANQRMNAYQVDAQNRIYKEFTMPSGAKQLEIKYRGNTANGSWGGGNYIIFYTSTGDELQVSHGWGDASGGTFGTLLTAQITNETLGTVLHREQMPRTFEEFHYTILIEDGKITHRGVRPNGELVFNYTFLRPTLRVAEINRLDVGVYQTVVAPLWLDDLAVRVIGSNTLETELIADDFSGSLGNNWTQMPSDISAPWTIQNGALIGNYTISAGGKGNTQSFILLSDANQPTGDWVASVDFAAASEGAFTTARATFGIWLSTTAKLKIIVGTGGWNWTPAPRQTVDFSVEHWTGSWSLVGLDGTANLNWNPAEWNTATLRKTGQRYQLSLNGTQVLEFTDTYLNGQGKLGLATYGPSRFDNFLLEEVTVRSAPTFTTQPVDQLGTAGGSVTFAAAANGIPAPTLQWQVSTNDGESWSNVVDGAPYSGATTASLTVSNLTAQMHGNLYRCLASNSVQSSVASAEAELSVTANNDRIIAIEGNLDFGETDVGEVLVRTLTITNRGTAPMTVNSIELPSGFTSNWAGGQIAAGSNQVVNVTFTPTAASSYEGTITINSDAQAGTSTLTTRGRGRSTLKAPRAHFASEVDVDSFMANWDTVTGAQSYDLEVSRSADFSEALGYNNLGYNNLASDQVSQLVSALERGTTYYYRVRARNSAGTGPYSRVITVATLSDAPTALAATSMEAKSFQANWNVVEGALDYVVEVASDEQFTQLLGYNNLGYNNLSDNALGYNNLGYNNLNRGSETSRTIYGLNPGAVYYYRVRAISASGQSANSNVISATTLPAAPHAVAATEVTTQSFRANWNPVAGATSYHVLVSNSASFDESLGYNNLGYNNLDSSQTSLVIENLQPGAQYHYRVTAQNASGAGKHSNAVRVRLAPPSPTATLGSVVSPEQFVANWTPASGASSYDVEVSTSSTFDDAEGGNILGYNNLDSGQGTSVSISGLVPGTVYYYRVRSRNEGGESAFSNIVSARVGWVFSYWQGQAFSSSEIQQPEVGGAGGDPDRDGLPNLLEYALGSDPKQPSPHRAPAANANASNWEFTYERAKDRVDVTYHVEWSTNLSDWFTSGVIESKIAETETAETWRAVLPRATSSNVFFRLKVRRP